MGTLATLYSLPIPIDRKNFAFALDKAGYNLHTLAEREDIHRSATTLGRYVREGKINEAMLETIAEALNVEPWELTSLNKKEYETMKQLSGKERKNPATPWSVSYPVNILKAAIACITDDELMRYDLRKILYGDFLSEQEKKILELRFKYRLTLDETAAEMQRTRERIRQIEAKALRKIRVRKHKLRLYTLEEVTEMIENARERWLAEMDEEEKQKSNGIDDQGIEELDLSIRTYNCLIRKGIKTIGDIKHFDQNQDKKKYSYWQSVRNLGKRSLEELRTKMREKTGYELTDIYGRDNRWMKRW